MRWAVPCALLGAGGCTPPRQGPLRLYFSAPAHQDGRSRSPPTVRAGGRAGAPLQGHLIGVRADLWGRRQAEPTVPATSDSDPSTTGATALSAACGPLSAESPGTTLLERLARPQTWKLSAVTPFSPGAVAARQARDIAARLSHWLAPQQALSPSKRPLVSNCPLATVRGPA